MFFGKEQVGEWQVVGATTLNEDCYEDETVRNSQRPDAEAEFRTGDPWCQQLLSIYCGVVASL